MKIWVDADACPRPVKEMLYRAAERTRLPLILVANQFLSVPPSPYIRALQVAGGFDEADHYIVDQLQPGDLVITADIPLAARVVEKGGKALDPRGELHTDATIRERLSVRDFMEELRSAGVETGGPQAYGQSERRAFGRALDKLLLGYPRRVDS
ncbi:YaiI/YqxD family protein [Parachitinimonas caeni]|uniref:UPF0178 protein PZA18_12340 n=1 Tax=Parachitinimonas caeni TaxID=3031301 RepID=A0ABT7DXN7_9NEIS|nr:YaiI/YqxD family protein [Parachitinimonas caeni]MDK2124834.1 YaiI/YqxD family protein [Parachitinimonas caeni]